MERENSLKGERVFMQIEGTLYGQHDMSEIEMGREKLRYKTEAD